MTITLKIITYSILLCIFTVSCKDESSQPLNPNGDSELAVLMRTMFDEVHQMKKQIANGDSIISPLNHEKILTAQATESQKVNSTKYKFFAKKYLETLKNIKSVNSSQKTDVYTNLVNNCIACHQSLCPGPIVKIKKLL